MILLFMVTTLKIFVCASLIGFTWGLILEFISKYIDHLTWEWWRVKRNTLSAGIGATAIFVLLSMIGLFIEIIF